MIALSDDGQSCIVDHTNPSTNSLERLYGANVAFPVTADGIHSVDAAGVDPAKISVQGMLCNGMYIIMWDALFLPLHREYYITKYSTW